MGELKIRQEREDESKEEGGEPENSRRTVPPHTMSLTAVLLHQLLSPPLSTTLQRFDLRKYEHHHVS